MLELHGIARRAARHRSRAEHPADGLIQTDPAGGTARRTGSSIRTTGEVARLTVGAGEASHLKRGAKARVSTTEMEATRAVADAGAVDPIGVGARHARIAATG